MRIQLQLVNENNIYHDSKILCLLKVSNNSDENVNIDNIVINFKCMCLISIINLRRLYKIADINRYISNIETEYINSDTTNKFDARTASSANFVICTKEKVLLERRNIKPFENYEGTFKIRFPSDLVPSYKSKKIQFSNVLCATLYSKDLPEVISTPEINLQIRYRFNYLSNTTPSEGNNHDTIQLDEYDDNIDDDCDENFASDDEFTDNPFLIIKNDEDNITGGPICNIDSRHAVNYKINYKEDFLCMIGLLKVPVVIGEEMRFLLNFSEDSKYRCIKFSVSIKSNETLIIPTQNLIEPETIVISEQELGPHLYDIACSKALSISLTIPNHQWYPSLEHNFFHHSWTVHFVFMIASRQDLNEPFDTSSSSKIDKDSVWSLNLHKKSDILTWDLPIRVIEAQKKQKFNLYSSH